MIIPDNRLYANDGYDGFLWTFENFAGIIFVVHLDLHTMQLRIYPSGPFRMEFCCTMDYQNQFRLQWIIAI